MFFLQIYLFNKNRLSYIRKEAVSMQDNTLKLTSQQDKSRFWGTRELTVTFIVVSYWNQTWFWYHLNEWLWKIHALLFSCNKSIGSTIGLRQFHSLYTHLKFGCILFKSNGAKTFSDQIIMFYLYSLVGVKSQRNILRSNQGRKALFMSWQRKTSTSEINQFHRATM